jgi:hypothetical protein
MTSNAKPNTQHVTANNKKPGKENPTKNKHHKSDPHRPLSVQTLANWHCQVGIEFRDPY